MIERGAFIGIAKVSQARSAVLSMLLMVLWSVSGPWGMAETVIPTAKVLKRGEFQEEPEIVWGLTIEDARVGIRRPALAPKSGEAYVVTIFVENVSANGIAVSGFLPDPRILKVSASKDGFLIRSDLPQDNSFSSKLAAVQVGNAAGTHLNPGETLMETYALDAFYDLKSDMEYLVFAERKVGPLNGEPLINVRSGTAVFKLARGQKTEMEGIVVPVAEETNQKTGLRHTQMEKSAPLNSAGNFRGQSEAIAKSTPAILAVETHQASGNSPNNHRWLILAAVVCGGLVAGVVWRAKRRET